MLETKINKLVDTGALEYFARHNGWLYTNWTEPNTNCQSWEWKGTPLSQDPLYRDNLIDRVTYEEVDWLIRSAPLTECQTSPSEYIRECRKWFDQHA